MTQNKTSRRTYNKDEELKRAAQAPLNHARTGSGQSGGNSVSSAPLTFARYSIACERHPERNEDSMIVDQYSRLAGVFDGVGGSAAGEVASQTAARAIYLGWKQACKQMQKAQSSPGRDKSSPYEDCDSANISDLLRKLTLDADEQVRTKGAMQAGTDDLATTVALAVFCRPPDQKYHTMVYAHVGDSRVYLLREQASLQRMTSDDGLLARLVENQIVSDVDAQRIDQALHTDQLSDLEFSYFRLRGGITQALGGPQPPTIHINQTYIQPGDRILLCTDGVHDNLTDEEIESILRKAPRATVARQLVEQALIRSREERNVTLRAKPDDISAIVVTCRF